ncbi:fibronectin type III and SPRY domain-containing protein 2-like isoform X1 [Lampetra fluviatilis]
MEEEEGGHPLGSWGIHGWSDPSSGEEVAAGERPRGDDAGDSSGTLVGDEVASDEAELTAVGSSSDGPGTGGHAGRGGPGGPRTPPGWPPSGSQTRDEVARGGDPGGPAGPERGLGQEEVHDVKAELEQRVEQLAARAARVESFVAELEDIFIRVEDSYSGLQAGADSRLAGLMESLLDRYSGLARLLEEERRLKTERLYVQLLQCGRGLAASRDLAAAARRAARLRDRVPFLLSAEAINDRIVEAVGSFLGVSPQPRTSADLLEFRLEFSRERRALRALTCTAAPSAPRLGPQEEGGATSRSFTVRWGVGARDVITHFTLTWRGAGPDSTERSVGVRGACCSCVVTGLEANSAHVVHVVAHGPHGASAVSEAHVYHTVPEAPEFVERDCAWCPDGAALCWKSRGVGSVSSFSLEFTRLHADPEGGDGEEGSGLRTISGIQGCSRLVSLRPAQRYRFLLRALNAAGPSDTGRALIIETRGAHFTLDPETAHPRLRVSEDGTRVTCPAGEPEDPGDAGAQEGDGDPELFDGCWLSVLGASPSPPTSRAPLYWEVSVDAASGFCVGLEKEGGSCLLRYAGEPSRLELLEEGGRVKELLVSLLPTRLGILYRPLRSLLSFYDAQRGQLLAGGPVPRGPGSARPALILEGPGSLQLHTRIPVPSFAA